MSTITIYNILTFVWYWSNCFLSHAASSILLGENLVKKNLDFLSGLFCTWSGNLCIYSGGVAEVSHSEKKDKLTLVTGLPLSLQYFKDLLFRLPKSRKKGNKERQCFGSGSELEGFPNQYWEDGSRSRLVLKNKLYSIMNPPTLFSNYKIVWVNLKIILQIWLVWL